MKKTGFPQAVLFLSMGVLAVSPKIIDTAYNGYIFAFLILLVASIHGAVSSGRHQYTIGHISIFVVMVPVVMIQTYIYGNQIKDVIRDLGAFIAFYIGYVAIPRLFYMSGSDWRIGAMKSLSKIGSYVALVTLIGAVMAYFAGVDAYFWRGEYVIFAHTWLPYFFAVNMGLVIVDPLSGRQYINQALFCVVGTLASLSRTDLVLMAAALIVQVGRNLRVILMDRRVRRFAISVLLAFLIALPYMLSLDVVQERIAVGVDEDDPSLAWRFIENLAFLEQFFNANLFTQFFGYGLGARLDLPFGILDFDGNNSIPHLHNSFFTIVLKFGFVGLSFLIIIIYEFSKALYFLRCKSKGGAELAAGWMLLFVLGKAVTLQGLSEWSHILFFGFALALVHKPPRKEFL